MKKFSIITLIFIVCIVFTFSVAAHERNDGGFYTVVDESGNKVLLTGWGIEVGDQFITENNKRYEIVAVEGDMGKAKFIGDINLSQYLPAENKSGLFAGLLQPRIAEAQGGKVAIYHTHSDESYVPTDGSESILGAGGIYKVGDAFAKALQNDGMDVINSMYF